MGFGETIETDSELRNDTQIIYYPITSVYGNGTCIPHPTSNINYKKDITGQIFSCLINSFNSDPEGSEIESIKILVEVLKTGVQCTQTQLVNCEVGQSCVNNFCT